MRYVFFPGCLSATQQYAYEFSALTVLNELGVEIIYPENVNCCGFPLRSLNSYGWIYLSARLMSVLEDFDAPTLLLCNWCHESLTYAIRLLSGNSELLEWVNELLKEEDLEFKGNLKFKHLIEVLHDDIGLEKISSHLKRKLEGYCFSIHPGCYSFRPGDHPKMDSNEKPLKLLKLVEVLGAEGRNHLDCCGWAISKTSIDVGLTLSGNRIKEAANSSCDGIIISCPHGGEIMETNYMDSAKASNVKADIPVLYYPQLLGLALGLKPEKVALHLNKSPVAVLLRRLGYLN